LYRNGGVKLTRRGLALDGLGFIQRIARTSFLAHFDVILNSTAIEAGHYNRLWMRVMHPCSN